MDLVGEYRRAKQLEDVGRLRRGLSLRAAVVSGRSQSQIAGALGMTQPAISQQLKALGDVENVHAEILMEAAAPILLAICAEHGYRHLGVFGSVARHEARQDSDIDLIVESPPGTSTFDFLTFKQLIERVLGRTVDLIDYGGLKPGIDDDIRREVVRL